MVSDELAASDRISVLMTVKNVISTIGQCLDSLDAQTVNERFEIVVIAADSDDGTIEYLQDRASRDGRLRLFVGDLTQPEALSMAFSKELVHTRYVAFIDGDVVADERWLEGLLNEMDSGALVAGGPCLTPKNVNLLQRLIGYELDMRFLRIVDREVTRLPNMNLCVDREFFGRMLFDLSLPIGYDMEFGHRLRAMGHAIRYNPNAIVYHYHRSSVRSYVRQQVNGARHALRVFRMYPSSLKGDNINSMSMMIDAPLMIALILFGALAPLHSVWSILCGLMGFLLLVSLIRKVTELAVFFREPETVLCSFLFLIRAQCWIIGLALEMVRATVRRSKPS